VIWGQKLTLNHPSLVDKGEEIRVSADGSQTRGGERKDEFFPLLITWEETIEIIEKRKE